MMLCYIFTPLIIFHFPASIKTISIQISGDIIFEPLWRKEDYPQDKWKILENNKEGTFLKKEKEEHLKDVNNISKVKKHRHKRKDKKRYEIGEHYKIYSEKFYNPIKKKRKKESKNKPSSNSRNVSNHIRKEHRHKTLTMREYFNEQPKSKLKYEKSLNKIDEAGVRGMTGYVLNHSLKLFKRVKKIMKYTPMEKVDFARQYYRDNFTKCIKNLHTKTTRDKFEMQSMILNAIETSHNILKFLFNKLKDNNEKQGETSEENMNEKLDELLKEEIDKQYVEACEKLGICRADYGYIDFCIEFFKELLKGDDAKLNEAHREFMKAIQDTDFSKGTSNIKNEELHRHASNLADSPTSNTRNIYNVFVQTLETRHDPNQNDKIISIMDLINAIENEIQPNDENVKEWKQMAADAKEYVSNNKPVKPLMQQFVRHLVDKGLNKIDKQIIESIQDKVKY